MRSQMLLLTIGLLLASSAACGGGDGTSTATPQIRSQRGLLVAAAVEAGQRAQDQLSAGDAGSADGGGVAPGSNTDVPGADSAPNASYSMSNDGLTVTGYGMAATDADSAVLELYFSTVSAYPRSDSSSIEDSPSGGATTPSATAISESDLQPVIDALVGAGVDRSNIEYIGGSYYDPYYASATLRATVVDVGNVGDLVQTATNATVGLTDVYLQSSYVSYTLSDCAALEEAAMAAAVSDADTRSTALAFALGVTRGAIQGASNDAYWPYGGTACSGGYVGPYAVGGVAYAEGQSRQVTMYSTMSITYAMD